MTHAVAQAGTTSIAPVKPAGLLLDFGGVLFLTSKPEGGFDRWLEWAWELGIKRGIVSNLEYEDLSRAFRAGVASLGAWKDNASREEFPRELTQLEMVRDHIAPGLPADVAELLVSEAGDLLAPTARRSSGWSTTGARRPRRRRSRQPAGSGEGRSRSC